MPQKNLVKLRCKKTNELRYTTRKKKADAKHPKLKLKKYSPKMRKMVDFEESKK